MKQELIELFRELKPLLLAVCLFLAICLMSALS